MATVGTELVSAGSGELDPKVKVSDTCGSDGIWAFHATSGSPIGCDIGGGSARDKASSGAEPGVGVGGSSSGLGGGGGGGGGECCDTYPFHPLRLAMLVSGTKKLVSVGM